MSLPLALHEKKKRAHQFCSLQSAQQSKKYMHGKVINILLYEGHGNTWKLLMVRMEVPV